MSSVLQIWQKKEGERVSEYTLYMDESETFNSAGNKYFVMSGVIIKNSNYSTVEGDYYF